MTLTPNPPLTNRIAQVPRRARLMLALGSLGVLAAACSSTSTAVSSASTTTATTTTGHHAGGRHRGHAATVGVITALPASALDLKVHATTETVQLVPATTYRQGKVKTSSAALKAGDKVRVVLTPGTSTPTAKTVVILPATTAYNGTLSALTPTGFVITSRAGKAHTVTTTSATTYHSGTTTATASALKDGQTVRVQGAPGSTGTLTASKVIIKATG